MVLIRLNFIGDSRFVYIVGVFWIFVVDGIIVCWCGKSRNLNEVDLV